MECTRVQSQCCEVGEDCSETVQGGTGLPLWAVISICVGIIFVVGGLVFVLFFYLTRKRMERARVARQTTLPPDLDSRKTGLASANLH
jgi:hypothetical protein